VETWYNSEHRPQYRRLILHRRVRDLPMPKVYIVDMRDEFVERKKAVVFSRLMERLLGQTLERGEQALLLMNRRGFAHRLYCPACWSRITCPNCSVGFVAHSATGTSMCHYCRAQIPTPTVCPNVTCGQPLVHTGLGTQRVEEVMDEVFPSARVQRVDSDTMRHRDQYQRIVDDFSARKVDVLIGTQMIAKGLDFPFVSFVGVVMADAGAMAGDFRIQERLFQLITQVAGRAGRADAPGKVVVQTTAPALPALSHALAHDYESFVAEELPARSKVGLPPFRRLARIVLTHAREETVRCEAEALWTRIRDVIEEQSLENADVLGPNPCLLARLRGKYRYDLLLRTANASSLRQLLTDLEESKALRTKADSLIIDVDPVSLT
jgi:primosomal protein N' (replication factor Y)